MNAINMLTLSIVVMIALTGCPPAPTNVNAPDLVGMLRSDAETAIINAELRVGNLSNEYSDTVLKDHVINQNPAAGTSLEIQSAIDLTLSTGPAPRTVPDLSGMTRSEAELTLANAGLLIGAMRMAYSDTVQAQWVISQEPDPGAPINAGGEVAITVSLGIYDTVTGETVGDISNSASKLFGTRGGTLEVEAGAPFRSAVLAIPSDALNDEAPVELGYQRATVGETQCNTLCVASAVFRFEKPVSLYIDFDTDAYLPLAFDLYGNVFAPGIIEVQDGVVTLSLLRPCSIFLVASDGSEKQNVIPESFAVYGGKFTPEEHGFKVRNNDDMFTKKGLCMGMALFAKWFYLNRTAIDASDILKNAYDDENQTLVADAAMALADQGNVFRDSRYTIESAERIGIAQAIVALHTINQPIVCHFYKMKDGLVDGGHAVLAYAYDAQGIYTYDPNFPKEPVQFRQTSNEIIQAYTADSEGSSSYNTLCYDWTIRYFMASPLDSEVVDYFQLQGQGLDIGDPINLNKNFALLDQWGEKDNKPRSSFSWSLLDAEDTDITTTTIDSHMVRVKLVAEGLGELSMAQLQGISADGKNPRNIYPAHLTPQYERINGQLRSFYEMDLSLYEGNNIFRLLSVEGSGAHESFVLGENYFSVDCSASDSLPAPPFAYIELGEGPYIADQVILINHIIISRSELKTAQLDFGNGDSEELSVSLNDGNGFISTSSSCYTYSTPGDYTISLKLLTVDDLEDSYSVTIPVHATLPETGSISGTVYDASTHRPLADVLVSGASDAMVSTSSDGAYTLSGIPEGNTSLRFYRSGYTGEVHTETVRADFTLVAQDTYLQPKNPNASIGSASGFIKDSLTNDGLDKVSISVYEGLHLNGALGISPLTSTTTNSSTGFYFLRDLPQGVYTGVAEKEDYVPCRFQITITAGIIVSDQDVALQSNLDTPPVFSGDTKFAGLLPEESIALNLGNTACFSGRATDDNAIVYARVIVKKQGEEDWIKVVDNDSISSNSLDLSTFCFEAGAPYAPGPGTYSLVLQVYDSETTYQNAPYLRWSLVISGNTTIDLDDLSVGAVAPGGVVNITLGNNIPCAGIAKSSAGFTSMCCDVTKIDKDQNTEFRCLEDAYEDFCGSTEYDLGNLVVNTSERSAGSYLISFQAIDAAGSTCTASWTVLISSNTSIDLNDLSIGGVSPGGVVDISVGNDIPCAGIAKSSVGFSSMCIEIDAVSKDETITFHCVEEAYDDFYGSTEYDVGNFYVNTSVRATGTYTISFDVIDIAGNTSTVSWTVVISSISSIDLSEISLGGVSPGGVVSVVFGEQVYCAGTATASAGFASLCSEASNTSVYKAEKKSCPEEVVGCTSWDMSNFHFWIYPDATLSKSGIARITATDASGGSASVEWTLLTTTEATSAVRYVTPDGAGWGSSWETAFSSIQSAIDDLEIIGGGEVWVQNGTYSGWGNADIQMVENVNLFGGFAGVESNRNARDADSMETIIDGEAWQRCLRGADKTIIDCFIFLDGLADYGGGIYNLNASPILRNCIFLGNQGDCGAGLYNENSSPALLNCLFIGNLAEEAGGAICNNDNSSPVLRNCTLGGNLARIGGGAICNYDSTVTATNCIFWGEWLHPGADDFVENSASTTTISYSCIHGGYEGEGNIDADPSFLDPEKLDLSLDSDSPCIDAGITQAYVNSDICGVTRPQGDAYDMGAFEYVFDKDKTKGQRSSIATFLKKSMDSCKQSNP